MKKTFAFEAVIKKAPDIDEAYVEMPFDIKQEFGKGWLKAHATFDREPCEGSIVNIGVKHNPGSFCTILGLRKDIRAKIGKGPGDSVKGAIAERESEKIK
jgi:hypothetical protein